MRSHILAVVALVVLTAAAQAQAGALFLTEEVIDAQSSTDCQEVRTYAMTDEAPAGSESEQVYMGMGAIVGCPMTIGSYTASSALTLESDVSVTLFLACDTPVPFVGVEGATSGLRFILMVGDTEIARHDFAGAGEACAPGDVVELAFVLPAAGTSVGAGSTIALDGFTFSPNPPDNLHILANSEAHPSRLEAEGLPEQVGPVADGPFHVFDDLDEGSFSHDFASPQNGTYTLNWTTEMTDVEISLMATPEDGTASVTVSDAAGSAFYTMDVDAETNDMRTFTDLAAGDWQIEVTYDAFVGTLDLSIEEHEADGSTTTTTTTGGDGGTTTTGGSPTATTTTGNGTAPPTTESDDSPAMWLPLVLIGIAVVALRRRR